MLDYYELEVGDQFMTYEFVSKGPKGNILKRVQFSLIGQEGVYNIALVDYDTVSGELSDQIISDNKDTEKVLATVAVIVNQFCSHFPDAWVYATGNTDSRTRLYRMGINKYFDRISQGFLIFGRRNGSWETYQQGISYQAFAIRKDFKFER